MRHCVRAFKSKPVPRELIREIIDYARFAACSKNMQPWKVIALSGQASNSLSNDLKKALFDGKTPHGPRQSQNKTPEKYWDRARQCGFALFQHKGIPRDAKEKRLQHYAENYHFFGAPVELFFLLHQDMPQRQLIDMGIFLERTMAKAQSLGLASCPQASVSDFPEILAKHLPIKNNMEVIFGLAIGYEDTAASVNNFRTEKLSVDDILTWIE